MINESDPARKGSDPELAQRIMDSLNGVGKAEATEVSPAQAIRALWHELEPEQQAAVVMGMIKEILPDERSREIREKLDISPTVEFLREEMGMVSVQAAAEQTGYSVIRLNYLMRQGQIPGVKRHGQPQWYTSVEAIETYRQRILDNEPQAVGRWPDKFGD
jgi:hypothetical protein